MVVQLLEAATSKIMTVIITQAIFIYLIKHCNPSNFNTA